MRSLILTSLVIIILSSCTGHKFLPQGERYYDGASIKITSEDDIPSSDIRETSQDIREVFKLTPNRRVLGMRPTVWFYNIAGEVEKKKGFRHWLKYKLGEEPVYISALDKGLTSELVQNRLELNGFFDYEVSYSVDSARHKAGITYLARVTRPYRMDSIYNFTQDSLEVVRIINSMKDESLLEKGDRYDFEVYQQERGRLEENLRNFGYYYFDDRSILFEADSTIGDRKVDIFPRFKDDTPTKSLQDYRINNVIVDANYDWSKADSVQLKDTVEVNRMIYLRTEERFRPEAITSIIALQPGALYSRNSELTTLNRLIQLDVFRYVNVNFEEIGPGLMDARVYLSPLKQNSLQFQVEAVGTSNNFVGPHVKVSWLHRNLFGGAERFQLNIYTGYEWQIGGGGDESLNNYEFGIENVLTFPRLITPLKIKYESARFLPETKVKLGARFQRRVGYYQLNSIHSDFGYEWRQTVTKRHKLYPAVVNYINLGNTTEEFDSILVQNPVLARSFEEQFVVGASYGYFFSSQEDPMRSGNHNFFFNANVDISGNLLYAINRTFNSEVSSETGNYTLLGQPYSQFIRASFDYRNYWKLNENSQLATRIITGVGYSYGNSVTIPYAYQFSVGGSNSLRGFRARSVGPGSFVPDSTITFIDQTGDVKLEANLEYRFDIIGAIKGAVFTDVGNVWAFREDEERPGAEFRWDTFYKQLAVDVGFGMRYDLKVFVIRLDLGWPVKLAYDLRDENGEKERFKMEFWKKDWRDRYLVWNIAIGYPF